MLTVDEDAILAEATGIAARYAERLGGREDFIARHHDPFRDMLLDTHARDIDIERLIRLR